ncbi:MAG: cbb3-type cytochrome oxidase assembly protein CcoS [Flavobacteriaceae bacterium]
MGVVYIMILVSLLIALLFFFLFIASVKSGQYDDTYTPSVRMLFDDEIVVEKKSEKSKSTN